MTIGVAMKWAPRRVEIDELTGEPRAAGMLYGASRADEAALETALRLGEHWHAPVVVATVGPVEADDLLRSALAAGAAGARRIEHRPTLAACGSPPVIASTGRALAAALFDCEFVVCGDYSHDGGTGAVPGFLAAARGAAQALGLLRVDAAGPGVVLAERRLDAGRRERLRLAPPAVISVEPGAARLRRASLRRLIETASHPIEVVPHPAVRSDAPVSLGPYRPRPRMLPFPPPSLDPLTRTSVLLGIGERRDPPRVVRAAPAEAAGEIAEQLRRWGYVG